MATFESSVERWRPLLSSRAGDVPVDFLLAWIQHESDGKTTEVTSIGERGIFQIHPDEATAIGLSSAQFAALTGEAVPPSGGSLNVDAGMKLVAHRRSQADDMLSKAGISWSGPDYWSFVKLIHALPLAAKEILASFQKAYGRAPSSWTELVTYGKSATDLSAKVSRNLQVLDNSTSIGAFAPKVLIGFGTALVLGVIAFFGWRWWKGKRS